MLPRIVLFALQLLAAWYLGEVFAGFITRGLAVGRGNEIFVYAVVYPLIVMLVGYAGSKVLKGVPAPSGATFVATVAVAVAFALLTLVPQITQVTEGAVPMLRGSRYLYPLAGAFIGYFIKR